MNSPFVSHEYYKQMLELQEKLRKSEEERIRLEERFNLLEQESRVRHETCINRLRMRYIDYLEEQRVRDYRNHKLLGTLDKIDNSLALMSAKTDKLCTLRREYEALLARACSRPSGDSGIVSQNEEKYLRRDTPLVYNRNDRLYHSPSTTQLTRSLISPRISFDRPTSRGSTFKPFRNTNNPFLDDQSVATGNYQRNYEFKSSIPKLGDDLWRDSFVKNDSFIKLFKKNDNENLVGKSSSILEYPEDIPQSSNSLKSILTSVINSDEKLNDFNSTNELDKYITKIKSLHNKNNQQNFEEIDGEQNTSGDLLNVTLSDDDIEHLPIENKERLNIPKNIEQILTKADDVLAKKVNNLHLNDDVDDSIDPIPESQVSSNHLLLNNDINTKIQANKLNDVLVKDGINQDIATRNVDLDQPYKNNEIIVKSNSNSAEIPTDNVTVDKKPSEVLTDNAIDKSRVFLGEQQEMEDDFYFANELEPWNLENYKRKIQEVFINENLNEGTDLGVESEVDKQNKEEIAAKNSEKDEIIPETSHDDEHGDTSTAVATSGEINTNVEYEAVAQDYESNPVTEETYQQDLNQNYQYPNEQYQDPNAAYQYDPNMAYDQQNINSEYPYDPQQYPEYNNANNQQMYSQDGQYYQDYSQYQDINQQYQQYDPNNTYEYPAGANQNYPTDGTYNYPPDNTYNEAQVYDYNQQQLDTNPNEMNENFQANDNESQEIINNDSQLLSIENTEQENLSEKLETEKKDLVKSTLESESTESTIEKNITNSESDFDFN